MVCSFGISVNFNCQKPWGFLFRAQKLENVLFLLENVSSKCSAGDEETFTGKTRVFVQFKVFSINSGEKDRNEFFSGNLLKTVFDHVDFSFNTPGEVLGQKMEFFHPKSEKGFKVIFSPRRSSFSSKFFSGNMECGFDNSAKTVSPKNWNF